MPSPKVPGEKARHAACRLRKRRMLQDIKLSRGCADCGYNAHAEALDFDHVRGEKSFTISECTGKGYDKLLAEVEKCDVVCANCHRVRTKERRGV